MAIPFWRSSPVCTLFCEGEHCHLGELGPRQEIRRPRLQNLISMSLCAEIASGDDSHCFFSLRGKKNTIAPISKARRFLPQIPTEHRSGHHAAAAALAANHAHDWQPMEATETQNENQLQKQRTSCLTSTEKIRPVFKVRATDILSFFANLTKACSSQMWRH